MTTVQHLSGQTFHARSGPGANAFRYGVDFVLLDPETATGPRLFSRNRANVTAHWTKDHGGAPGRGLGAAWARQVLGTQGLDPALSLTLLAQPRVLGHVFNPVAFWLARDGAGALRAVIAEVTNTYGDRHSYLCHRPDLGPIHPSDRITAAKVFHVSPFQPIAGAYVFRFDLTPHRIGIFIDLETAPGVTLHTSLTGRLRPLTNTGILSMLLRRPFGSRRVLALIHWQALKLWWKGAPFRPRPIPPVEEVSR